MITEDVSRELANKIANELEYELKQVCPVRTGTLKDSIEVVKDGNEYVIKMKYYWKYVEYLSNPFVRYTINTKLPDILQRVTNQISSQ